MKTVTVRIDDDVYNLLKKAADGERRTISNFMENASLSYVTNELYVSDIEMDQILSDKSLIKGLKKGIDEAKKGKYKIVK
jgi:predicted transcriptional regulator